MAISIQNAVKAAKMPDTIKNTATAKYVLLVLADRANETHGECYPSQDLIAWETELSLSTVKRSIKALKQAQLIQIQSHWRSGRKHNTYRINIQLLHSLKREPLTRGQSPAPASERQTPTNHSKTAAEENEQKMSVSEPECFVDQLPADEFFWCREAIEIMQSLNNEGCNFYTGPLRQDEWEWCESQIAHIDTEYFVDLADFLKLWAKNCAHRFSKAVSLPNIFPELMNDNDGASVVFNQFEYFQAKEGGDW